MTRIKYTLADVQTISFFESLTHSRLRDCIDTELTLYFVVEPFELGRALGKNAMNVRRLEEKLNRKVKIVEFNPDIVAFITNLSYPVRPARVVESEGVVTITPPDLSGRGILIGRGATNLRAMEKVAQRYFPIKQIKVQDHG